MRSSLRFRLTAMATVMVAAVLLVAAVVLFFIQRQQLTSSLDTSLNQQADFMVAALVEADDDGGEEREELEFDDLVSIIEAAPNSDAFEYRRVEIRPASEKPPTGNEGFRWVSRSLGDVEDQGPATLYVGESTEEIDETVGGLIFALLATIPVVAAVMAGLLWWLTGRALNPLRTFAPRWPPLQTPTRHNA